MNQVWYEPVYLPPKSKKSQSSLVRRVIQASLLPFQAAMPLNAQFSLADQFVQILTDLTDSTRSSDAVNTKSIASEWIMMSEWVRAVCTRAAPWWRACWPLARRSQSVRHTSSSQWISRFSGNQYFLCFYTIASCMKTIIINDVIHCSCLYWSIVLQKIFTREKSLG